MIEQHAFRPSCEFSRNILYCSIESNDENVEFAFYININGEQKKKYWYSTQKSIQHDCGDEIVHMFEVSFFLRKSNGEITSGVIMKKTNWAVCDGITETIELLLNSSSKLLEFGSGAGSEQLAKHCSVQSIEHDERFLGMFPNVSYTHAPLVGVKPYMEFNESQWYDFTKIKAELYPKYDLILLDGPPAEYGRSGILRHIKDFDISPIWIVDDVLRTKDQLLANYISLHLSMIQYRFWNFSILAKKPIDNSILSKIHAASKKTLNEESDEYLTRYYPSYATEN